MNVLRSLTSKCTKQQVLKNCQRDLSENYSVLSFIKNETNGKHRTYSDQRKFHRDSKNENNDTKELLTDKEPIGMLQASGAVVRLPDSYFYMKVNEQSRNLDCKPPGTHLKSGAIKNKPVGAKLGRLRAFALVVTLIYMGGQLSSLAARMLHEFEIFSLPDDDDD